MFTCIACTKQTTDEREEEGVRESSTPSTKEAVKSLTTQIKDMALKFSGAYKQCKPCTGSSSYKKGHRPYPDFDTISEGVPYPYIGGASSSSTPAWDFTTSHYPGGRSDPRFAGAFGGDRTPRGRDSASVCDVVLEDEDEPKEWMAVVEPGVHITFVSLPNGGNDLKRIRFSREMFNKWQAQRWWGENYDRIMELYNVQRFNRQALNTPPRSEDEPRDSTFSRLTSAQESPMPSNKDWTPRSHYKPSGSRGYYPSEPLDHGGGGGHLHAGPSMEPARDTTASRDEPSISNASEMEAEWVEQDEPGVYITIRQLADGTRELRRVRFSRERFGEVNAKTWWEENRERIQAQYL
ncbi:protein BREVIS RADIX [Vigna radiata var. radiata]|uniref:Protein BREVIS RADIX n=1 Tax=Vigna radiata var. radiata TaxID=3916 RepID=A0A1S3UPD8_VIGRR|nr:protein BREVIS RADIX [Vigna radiata var. radiata]XP_022638633.1 protein BREVIS RADIX [Vigna radiata var. radiata]XP_022638634.1 protein BREVIS RADIX [Vigna radiata var. radiata]XP_022638635.1 protein BREVIS RADIX [Vigna radiata var. radiata]XP_022638636.1 protein BREVIS RADIX [Vigna radiata var. radiata]XP_022638637.1 protein BREVIS RADIX [Vigna radiata var. radiata]XP_022638638.1 protein BREVIS RADIX [Vigna radiata var. radiata]